MHLLPGHSIWSSTAWNFLVQEISLIKEMFKHVLCILTEKNVLAFPVFVEWMDEWQMLFHFSFIYYFYEFKFIEVLLSLLNVRDLWLNMAFVEAWIKEVIFIVIMNRCFTLNEDFSEPLSVVSVVFFPGLVNFEIRVVLIAPISLDIPFHSNLAS